MRKLALTLVALFLMVLPAFSEHVSVQTGQKVAQSFLNSKIEDNLEIHLIESAGKVSFHNFYIFGNEHCFVIISADDCVHPVLGYSTEGKFSTKSIPDEVWDWLKGFDDEITSVKALRLEALPEIRFEWECLLSGRGLEPKSRSHVDPLIRTRWNQKSPFNNFCPPVNESTNCVAGCGAIAIAQLMNYWEHPVMGDGYFSYTPSQHPEYGVLYANFGATVYDWDNMRNEYAREYADVEAIAVATLVYHAAVSVSMSFTPSFSGTNILRFKNALTTYFDYSTDMELKEKSNYSDTQWISMMKNDLDAERPIIYRGCDSQSAATNGTSGVAHVFNCDGYDENNLFHFNWGHAGEYDGYYAIGALYPGHEYDHGNKAIFNCHPNVPSINPPASVNAFVEGQEVTVTWSTVPGAVSYKLYRDDDFLSNVTGNSYYDCDVDFGLHSYTVKSVKSDGTMSFRSIPSVADVHFSGPKPSNLQATVNDHDVSISWNTPTSENTTLHYGLGYCIGSSGYSQNQNDNPDFYWAHRYPVSILQQYAGMAVEKVAFYFCTSGVYTVFVYKGNETQPTELLHQQSFRATAWSWQDITFVIPIEIDYTQDLWIVFYSKVRKPATCCAYDDVKDARLYSYNGERWRFDFTSDEHRSWLIKTYITDGTYTYNLYRNGDAIATNLSGNTYTDSNLPEGIYDYHVTTNYFGGESDPSNSVNVQIDAFSSQTTNFTAGWNWWSANVDVSLDALKTSLVEALGNTTITIRSQSNGSTTYNGSSWRGTLTSLDVIQMYKIKTTSNCDIALTGMHVNPTAHSVIIHKGGNWFAFPFSQSMTVSEAFAGFAVNGDMVISQSGSSTYNGSSWRGNLIMLEPNKGYIYKSNAAGSRIYTYPSAK